MRLTLLGSGSVRPFSQRYLTSLVSRVSGENLLFDVPENTQVQLQKYESTMDLDRVFLTALRPSTVFGIPGLLTTLANLSSDNSGLRDFEIYAPRYQGAETYLEKILSLCPFTPEVQYVSPGDIAVETGDYSVSVFRTNGKGKNATVGYRIEEVEQKGRFNREKAESLGVPVGPKFGQLHDGNAVELENGQIIRPEQVVGDARPGRSFAYTGATGYLEDVPEALCGVDVALIDGGFDTEGRTEGRLSHMTAYEAGTIAGAADISVVVLTHIQGKYNKSTKPLVEDITEAFDGLYIIGEDGVSAELRTHESERRQESHLSDVFRMVKGHSSIRDFEV